MESEDKNHLSSLLLSFEDRLIENRLELVRSKTETLQINVGPQCNLTCKHCHVEAGPDRTEVMDLETVNHIIDYTKRSGIKIVDITGGAPELSSNLEFLIRGLRPDVERIMLRSNLVLLHRAPYDRLIDLFTENSVEIIGSVPSLSEGQTDAQRGEGVFKDIVKSMQRLNKEGYGKADNRYLLNIVVNPSGAFFHLSEDELEKRYKEELDKRYGVVFNSLFAFANVPIGRFGDWLDSVDNLDAYYSKLEQNFNQASVNSVMCRHQLSVSWNGMIYDCDFNLALDIPLAGVATHISELNRAPAVGTKIAVADHCYTCVAGGGFTCGGSIQK
ncbi:MAG: arsenosugar biosynthesis radical SAM (seleno)protein ArsS [Nitrospinota bacterium]